MKVYKIILLLLSINLTYAQESQLKNGPMLGYVTHREAAIWIQTKKKQRLI